MIQSLVLSENEAMIARPIVKEVGDRLSFLKNVKKSKKVLDTLFFLC